jgi:hypothetical protein
MQNYINYISQKKTVTTMKRNTRIMDFPVPEISEYSPQRKRGMHYRIHR